MSLKKVDKRLVDDEGATARNRITKVLRFAVGVTVALISPGIGAAQPQVIGLHAFADSQTPLSDLLPAAPHSKPSPESWVNDDLAQVPEVRLQDTWSVFVAGSASDKELSKAELKKLQELSRAQAMEFRELTAQQIAKIRFLNKKRDDHFLELLQRHRPDLAGLPFVLGDASRLDKTGREKFAAAVLKVREALRLPGTREAFWKKRQLPEDPLAIAALTQMLATEPALTPGFIEHLAQCDTKEATRALARLAIFSAEDWVRQASRAALQQRDTGPATDLLLHGLHYPWPAVAQHSAEAIDQLRRTDLVPELANMLDEPDPRAPVSREIDGKRVYVVRELVRINHLRNCLLCHPPANLPDASSLAALEGGVPAPSRQSSRWTNSGADFWIRADATYLRQDFSLLQSVPADDPGPPMQRFDYLVRERVLTDQEAQAYQAEFAASEAASPYRQAARTALRGLTIQNASAMAPWIALGCTCLVVLQGSLIYGFRRRRARPRSFVSVSKLPL